MRDAASVTTFVHCGIPTQVNVDVGSGNDPRILVLIETKERDSGDDIIVQLGDPIPHTIETADEALDFIYERVRAAWLHELNEAMHVLGVRRMDLHDDQGNTLETM